MEKNWIQEFEKFFTFEEFDSPDSPGSGKKKMQDQFLQRLTRARKHANVPFSISSGYRTPKHNKKVGGVRGSAHTKGFAADIRCRKKESAKRFKIIQSLILVGFTRIGVSDNFIHVDCDPSKNEDRIWTY